MKNFIYTIPTTVYFGKNQLKKLSNALPSLGSNILLVYGQGHIKKQGIYREIINILQQQNIIWKELSGIQPNPRFTSVLKGIKLCKDHKLTGVLAAGGGSTIDCAKAIAAGYYHKEVWPLFAGNEHIITEALPVGTILTLAATGSEMNGNAVITNEQTQEKLAIHSDVLRPRFSILDPTYTFSLPKQQTAAGSVDIFSHLLEQYFSPTKEAFLQDRLAEAMMKTVLHYTPIALDDPTNYEARSNLMWTSSLALNKLLTYGKTTDWATHQMEHALSAVTDVTHGVGLAVLTPYWMSHVLSDETIEKFVAYARNVWNLTDEKEEVAAKKSIHKTQEFFSSLGMPRTLKELGVQEDQLDLLAKKAVSYGAIGGVKRLEYDDVHEIFTQAYSTQLVSLL